MGATSFNQPVDNWDTSSVTNKALMFHHASALSDTNKGKIHAAFSSNKNWTYDWSAYAPKYSPLTDANFKSAISLWFSDEANATATYGHIRNWDVSAVTSDAFKNRSAFNDNIGGWDVSSVKHAIYI